MKRFSLILPLLVLLVLPSPAFAKVSDKYVGLKVAYSSVSPEATFKSDKGWSVDYKEDDYSAGGAGLVFGATLAQMSSVNLRLELEALIRFGNNEMEYVGTGGTTTLEINTNSSILLGLYLDFPITKTVTPYIGALAGVSIFGYEQRVPVTGNRIYKQSGAGAAFQYGLGGGVDFKLNRRMSIDLGARYLWSTDATIDDTSTHYVTDWETDVSNNILDVSLGFRYHF